jgi:hypothetical protein
VIQQLLGHDDPRTTSIYTAAHAEDPFRCAGGCRRSLRPNVESVPMVSWGSIDDPVANVMLISGR